MEPHPFVHFVAKGWSTARTVAYQKDDLDAASPLAAAENPRPLARRAGLGAAVDRIAPDRRRHRRAAGIERQKRALRAPGADEPRAASFAARVGRCRIAPGVPPAAQRLEGLAPQRKARADEDDAPGKRGHVSTCCPPALRQPLLRVANRADGACGLLPSGGALCSSKLRSGRARRPHRQPSSHRPPPPRARGRRHRRRRVRRAPSPRRAPGEPHVPVPPARRRAVLREHATRSRDAMVLAPSRDALPNPRCPSSRPVSHRGPAGRERAPPSSAAARGFRSARGSAKQRRPFTRRSPKAEPAPRHTRPLLHSLAAAGIPIASDRSLARTSPVTGRIDELAAALSSTLSRAGTRPALVDLAAGSTLSERTARRLLPRAAAEYGFTYRGWRPLRRAFSTTVACILLTVPAATPGLASAVGPASRAPSTLPRSRHAPGSRRRAPSSSSRAASAAGNSSRP